MSVVHGTLSEKEEKLYKCRKCGKKEAECRSWDSICGGYTDYRYDCRACGHRWWGEGSDA